MAINQAVHFTDWVIGHSHLAMLGFATFAAAGGLVHAWQRIPWARYNARAIEWSYWLLRRWAGADGVVDLTDGRHGRGDGCGSRARRGSSRCSATRPYWIVRSLPAIPLAAGFVALLVGLTTGPRGAGLHAIDAACGAEPVRRRRAPGARGPVEAA